MITQYQKFLVLFRDAWQIIVSFRSYINKHPFIASLFVFVAVFVFYGVFYFPNQGISYLDDHFFHFKYAYLLRTEGLSTVKNFDWVYYHSKEYVAPFYFFNIAQIPFTYFRDMLFGLKFNDVFWASLSLSVFYYTLRKSRVKLAFLAILMLLSSDYFVFRMLSGRPLVLSVTVLFLLIYLAVERKVLKLFLLTLFFTVWHHSLFFMPFLAILIVEIARYLVKLKIYLNNLLCGLLAVVAGFVILPSFPQNIFNLTKMLFDTLDITLSKQVMGQGVELYKVDVIDRFIKGPELFLLMAILSSFFVMYYYVSSKIREEGEDLASNEDHSKKIIMAYSLFIFLLVCVASSALISGRFYDYYLPTVVFLTIWLATLVISQNKIIFENLTKNIVKTALFFFFAILFFVRLLDLNISSSRNEPNLVGQVAQWVESKSNPKELVFLHNWSDFAVAFFYNHKNVYTMGMDPINLFSYSPELYWKWYNIFHYNYYCEKAEDCAKDKEAKLNVLKDQSEEKKKEFEEENSLKIINSIKKDFNSRFIITGFKPFEDVLAFNQDLIEEKYEVKSEKTGKVVTAYKLK